MANIFATSTSYAASTGKELYREYQCQICHGAKGATPAQKGYPRIAGQEPSYLYRQLIDIRDGVRENGRSIVMRPLMQNLSDQELEAIAEYLSQLQWNQQ
ncbi:MAG: c-type cytochrome [Porticoccus sp.]